MVLYLPRPTRPAGPPPHLAPETPLPDLEPGPPKPMLLSHPRTMATAAPPKVSTQSPRPRRKRKRIRMIFAMALTASLVLSLAGPSTWPPSKPSRHSRSQQLEQRPVAPAGVITQARARQHRRRRNIALTTVAVGTEIAVRAAGVGSPPPRRHRSRIHNHGGASPPPPQAERLRGLPANSSPAIYGLSCPSSGNCALDGAYSSGTGSREMFVANEVHGRWGKAEEIRGLPASVTGLTPVPVSCRSAGNCLAAGNYTVKDIYGEFVVAEHNGIWGGVQQIPGLLPDQTVNIVTSIDTLSCGSAGNCTVGGLYMTRVSPHGETPAAFVASETNGQWGKAQLIRGVPVKPHWPTVVLDISCTSAGNCAAAGTYPKVRQNTIDQGVFTASELDGVWGPAELLHGIVDQLPEPTITQLSCASVGNCSLIGDSHAQRNSAQDRAFVASQIDGTWGNSEPISGIKNDDATTGGVSCLAPGECTADVNYNSSEGNGRPYTVTETNGVWHGAKEVPGITTPSSLRRANFAPISCASRGNCLMGGISNVSATSFAQRAVIATEIDGTWQDTQEVSGIPTLLPTHMANESSQVELVSCPVDGLCSGAGLASAHSIRGPSQADLIFVID
jgi:hypothetical protein